MDIKRGHTYTHIQATEARKGDECVFKYPVYTSDSSSYGSSSYEARIDRLVGGSSEIRAITTAT